MMGGIGTDLANGNYSLLVTESGNKLIRRVQRDGWTETYAGKVTSASQRVTGRRPICTWASSAVAGLCMEIESPTGIVAYQRNLFGEMPRYQDGLRSYFFQDARLGLTELHQKQNLAFKVFGKSDYAMVEVNDLYFTTGVTVELWFLSRANSWPCTVGFCAVWSISNRGLGLALLARDKQSIAVGDEYLWRDTNAKINTEQWNHVAVTANFPAKKATLYLNGKKMWETHELDGNFYGNFFIGGPPSTSEKNFHGMLDEVKIWRRILSESEIRANMNRPLDLVNVVYKDLVNYFNFDQLADIPKGNTEGKVSNQAPLTTVKFSIILVQISPQNWVISEAPCGYAATYRTFAGSGSSGYQNGLGLLASFGRGEGLAVNAGGQLYLADWQNGMLRTINSATGLVEWYAGLVNLSLTCLGGDKTCGGGASVGLIKNHYAMSAGFVDGRADKASFYSPYGLAIPPTRKSDFVDKVDVAGKKTAPEFDWKTSPERLTTKIFVADTGNASNHFKSILTPS